MDIRRTSRPSGPDAFFSIRNWCSNFESHQWLLGWSQNKQKEAALPYGMPFLTRHAELAEIGPIGFPSEEDHRRLILIFIVPVQHG